MEGGASASIDCVSVTPASAADRTRRASATGRAATPLKVGALERNAVGAASFLQDGELDEAARAIEDGRVRSSAAQRRRCSVLISADLEVTPPFPMRDDAKRARALRGAAAEVHRSGAAGLAELRAWRAPHAEQALPRRSVARLSAECACHTYSKHEPEQLREFVIFG